jgi:hypothetical protein
MKSAYKNSTKEHELVADFILPFKKQTYSVYNETAMHFFLFVFFHLLCSKLGTNLEFDANHEGVFLF